MNVKEERVKRHISRKLLAEALDLHVGTVVNKENNDKFTKSELLAIKVFFEDWDRKAFELLKEIFGED